FFSAGDMLVLNDTRVMPARLIGKKSTGGGVEILLTREIYDDEVDGRGSSRWLVMLKGSKGLRIGAKLTICGGASARLVEEVEGGFWAVDLTLPDDCSDIHDYLASNGEIPLPPYMRRSAEELDTERYQTVFADVPGAVAAPTAGLHFTRELLDKIQAKGVKVAYLTLHVGPGTFLPVRVDDISKHKMHSEWYEIDEEVYKDLSRTKEKGGRVIAVGTTVTRALEAAAMSEANGTAKLTGDTDIFITPGFEFKVVDALLTNFHLPKSTLLMLVSAFAGRDNILKAYKEAIEEKYRFFSYGDSMIILQGYPLSVLT
ncbi:MAG: tRNA preQ1(34) S-adenosylmethionine ribosyltransferase-isomerase QueA, partial [bacterium]|nr:tRNA preQ1(34) S-adenosylmethionine ribosyltransferase-isomerase QueA [bacterium]